METCEFTRLIGPARFLRGARISAGVHETYDYCPPPGVCDCGLSTLAIGYITTTMLSSIIIRKCESGSLINLRGQPSTTPKWDSFKSASISRFARSQAATSGPRNLSGLNSSGSRYTLGSAANHAIDVAVSVWNQSLSYFFPCHSGLLARQSKSVPLSATLSWTHPDLSLRLLAAYDRTSGQSCLPGAWD
jgi:hypothetical protein